MNRRGSPDHRPERRLWRTPIQVALWRNRLDRHSGSPRVYAWHVKRRKLRAIDLVDVLVYLVVLCAFTQLFPEVISESFLTSLATAMLLKIVLEGIMWAKERVIGRIRGADTRRRKVIAALALPVLGAGSKALILWLTDVLLGDAVYLGGFWAVTLLVITLMAARALVRKFVS